MNDLNLSKLDFQVEDVVVVDGVVVVVGAFVDSMIDVVIVVVVEVELPISLIT